MIVCVCRRVSDRDIRRAAAEGVSSFDEMQDELGVATGCGACLDCARETWAEACHAGASCPGAAMAAGRSGQALPPPVAPGRRLPVVPIRPLHASAASSR